MEIPTGVSVSQFKRPKQPPQYFAIDIDNTLYTKNEEAFERNVEAFAKVKQMGYTPFLCTGRSHRFGLKVLGGSNFTKRTNYNGYPGIYNNGSLAYDENGVAVYSKPSFRDCMSNYIDFWTWDAFVNKQRSRLLHTFHWTMEMSGRVMRSFVPCSIVHFTKRALGIVTSLCGGVLDNRGALKTLKFEEDAQWDFRPPGVNKAIAISALMAHYNVPTNDCAFIGDFLNDIEAMDLLDLSFAVANAPDFVKKHAKWVLTKSHDQGAVAEALTLVYGL